MKTLFYFACMMLMLAVINARGQQVISSTGGTWQNANGTLSYTLGELVIDTRTAGNTTITQGFHQTKLTVTSVEELTDLPFTILAYPNPTSDWIILKTEKGTTSKLVYTLYDMNGKAMSNGKLVNGEAEISFVSLKPATYILKVLQDGREIKTVQIVKQ